MTPGRTYLNVVKARCPGALGQARVQVNWADARNGFVHANLVPFDCMEQWREHEQEVVAPPQARFAVVYATSQTAAPVEIGAVSFRGLP